MLKGKKVLCFLFVMLLLFSSSSMGLAHEKDANTLFQKLDKSGISRFEMMANPDISPLWNPGDGPAPQVTKIELYDYGWLNNGNFGVILKVYGYGQDESFFNGSRIYPIQQIPFIIYGIGADGFYYVYDCGPVTEPDDYKFETTFTSINPPYSKVYFYEWFTFYYQ